MELIKRIAFLRGAIPEPFSVAHLKSDEEIQAEELLAEAVRHARAEAELQRTTGAGKAR